MWNKPKPIFYSLDKVPAFIRRYDPRKSKITLFYNNVLPEIVERLEYDIERYKKTNDGHISRSEHEMNCCTLWYIMNNHNSRQGS